MPSPVRTDERIAHYLRKGWTLEETAKKCKVSVRWVNTVASTHSLPRNSPIALRGEFACRIDRALVATNMNIPMVAALFQQAPCNIEAYVKAVAANSDIPVTVRK